MEIHFIYQCVFIICTLGSIICDDGGTHSKHVFTYEGSGETIFSCNGSDVINVTDIQLTNHPTDCHRYACNLTNNDVNHIESCNGKSSCDIPMKDMSPCIKDSGFYSVDYSCQINAINCDFENGFCGWEVTNGDWSIVQANNSGYLKRDHTTGSGHGHYLHVETRNNELDVIRSARIPGSAKQCLTFYYYITDYHNTITLYKHSFQNETEQLKLHKIDPNSAHLWQRMVVFLNDVHVSDYTLAFEVNGSNNFAVDDITILNTDCLESQERTCSFESGVCGWNADSPWIKHKGTTWTSRTGPVTDHSTTKDGYYVYMEASDMENGDKAYLYSPTYSLRGNICFMFWYLMYGKEMGNLTVYYKSNSRTGKPLFSTCCNQKRRWQGVRLDLTATENFKIIIDGKRGNGSKSDIAIDDLSLLPGNCVAFEHYTHHCRSVDETVMNNDCPKSYRSSHRVHFDPEKETCRNFFNEIIDSVCDNYNNNYNGYCNMTQFVREKPSCFNLNSLFLEYTCEERLRVTNSNQRREDNDSTGMIVGVVVGFLLIVGAIFAVLFIIHYRRRRHNTAQNKRSTSNYSASWHSNSQESSSDITLQKTSRTKNIQPINNGLAVERTTNNPSYGQGYIISASNKTNNKQDTEYINITAQNGNLIPRDGKYNVLDPVETGFNRSYPDEYELASPVNENLDDNYAESGAGVYDISGNSRHKVKDTIYDHSVDDTYDTSNRGREEELGDYTYNHVFGKQTEDDYDIAGS